MKSDGIRVALDQCEAFSDKNSTSFCQFILNEFINKVLQSSAETNSKITGQTTETCEEICRKTSDQNIVLFHNLTKLSLLNRFSLYFLLFCLF